MVTKYWDMLEKIKIYLLLYFWKALFECLSYKNYLFLLFSGNLPEVSMAWKRVSVIWLIYNDRSLDLLWHLFAKGNIFTFVRNSFEVLSQGKYVFIEESPFAAMTLVVLILITSRVNSNMLLLLERVTGRYVIESC